MSAAGATAAAGNGVGLAAVVLAGGRGSRLGGVDKASLALRGARMVDRAVAAARGAGAREIVVVGPESARSAGARLVREDPPFSGPAAALDAALPLVGSEWLLLLSCDLVYPDRACALLVGALPAADAGADAESGADGALLRDDEGRDQWAIGLYRTAAVRTAAQRLRAEGGGAAGASLRRLLGELRLRRLDAPAGSAADIDEPADLERARLGEAAPD